MSAGVQLVLGCLGLGLVIGYAWWARVRDDVLRLDLARIRDRLDAAMRERGEGDDENYLRLRRFINFLIGNAPYLTPSLFLCRGPGRRGGDGATRAEGEAVDRLTSLIASFGPVGEVAKEVSDAGEEVGLRLVLHWLFGCLSTWWLLARIAWRSTTGRLKDAAVPASLIRLTSLYSGPTKLARVHAARP